MYLFLYKAARHVKPTWGCRRLSQSTIRNDFKLDLLKSGIKDRYKLVGHGIHDFQKLMAQLGMEEDFYGHIFLIEEPKNAVWFKLNYDQIGKPGTEYIGGWKDINANDLAAELAEMQLLRSEQQKITSDLNQIRYLAGSTNTIINRLQSSAIKDDFKSQVLTLNGCLQDTYSSLTESSDQISREIQKIRDIVKQYLKDHEL